MAFRGLAGGFSGKRLQSAGPSRGSGPSFQLPNDNRAFGFGLVQHLTMQAVHAFVRVDLAGGMDRLDRAFIGAGLARRAALLIPLEPVKHPYPRRDRKGRAQRANIAAIEPFDEQTDP